MIEVGHKVIFNPLGWMRWHGQAIWTTNVIGTVVFIHNEHRWFLVEYTVDDYKIRVAFDFNDIGKSVKFV